MATVTDSPKVAALPGDTIPATAPSEPEKAIPADLGAIIPSARGRVIAYAGFMLVSLTVTNVAVGFTAVGASFPDWLKIAIAVVGNLATPFGALAIANAKPGTKQ